VNGIAATPARFSPRLTARGVRASIDGSAGLLDGVLDRPEGEPRGVAVVCHPHPQFGGTLDNKVVQTLARAFLQLGWAALRFDFRGVGASEGAWDEGRGEVDDALAAADFARRAVPHAPLVLAGFSFGGYVAASAAARLPEADRPLRLVLVAPSTEKQRVPAVPADTVVVHGDADDVVPLAATLAWAWPQTLPVVVLPGVGHFFHGQLALLKTVLVRELHALSTI